jgi:hypothetical protein
VIDLWANPNTHHQRGAARPWPTLARLRRPGAACMPSWLPCTARTSPPRILPPMRCLDPQGEPRTRRRVAFAAQRNESPTASSSSISSHHFPRVPRPLMPASTTRSSADDPGDRAAAAQSPPCSLDAGVVTFALSTGGPCRRPCRRLDLRPATKSTELSRRDSARRSLRLRRRPRAPR